MVTLSCHGTFEHDEQFLAERIYLVRLIGQWNIQQAQEFVEYSVEIIEQNFVGKEWAAINDMSQWDLCTPDVIEYFNESIFRFTERNFRWHAVIPSNQVQKMVTNGVQEAVPNSPLTTQYYTNQEDALRWLRAKLS